MWRCLLALHDQVYFELVIEFYSTFEHTETEDWRDRGAIKIRLGGEYPSMSYHDLAAAFDLVPVDSNDFVVEVANPSGCLFLTVYHQLARPPYDTVADGFTAGHTKASTLQTEYGLLHHLLTKSYNLTSESASTLTKWSLYLF
ncbi:unnamed protein product [Linum trigynum]|uniref:Uncharacterized protein n=1 Tax=Linum trigynum TaxID=586398 RepID=A0AAV2FRJ3_9ROSI